MEMEIVWTFWNNLLKLPGIILEYINQLPDFVIDALNDSISLIPFLFIIFLVIELIEQYYTKKKHLFVFFIKKVGPLFGSLFASIPQCGFSVIASTIYTKRLLSRGTLVAVYLATSDEAIPVLLTYPEKSVFILPIILLKIIIAIAVGYLVDFIIRYNAKVPLELNFNAVDMNLPKEQTAQDAIAHDLGCCQHEINKRFRFRDFWVHPLRHTFNIFVYILFITMLLSYLLSRTGSEEMLAKYCLINTPLQPFLVSLVGLIPNCAISVMLTMLYIKNTITFGSLMAGLCSAGGLGILVLLKNNRDKKDTFIILSILVIVGTLVGLIIQM